MDNTCRPQFPKSKVLIRYRDVARIDGTSHGYGVKTTTPDKTAILQKIDQSDMSDMTRPTLHDGHDMTDMT